MGWGWGFLGLGQFTPSGISVLAFLEVHGDGAVFLFLFLFFSFFFFLRAVKWDGRDAFSALAQLGDTSLFLYFHLHALFFS